MEFFMNSFEAAHFSEENPKRISLEEVKLDVNYVLIITTTAGLWAYNIGDTVKFVSLTPYRILVTGRIKHFISAFGEHVIGKEVETAIEKVCLGTSIQVKEFTVAPQIKPENGLPYHEWFVDFVNPPEDFNKFAESLDIEMQTQNVYYEDLIKGKVLKQLVVTQVASGGFQTYMKSIGKLGGQNKIPRLSDDRKICNQLPLK